MREVEVGCRSLGHIWKDGPHPGKKLKMRLGDWAEGPSEPLGSGEAVDV